MSARADASNEAGYSLVELLIAMSIFAIFIAVLLASVIGISRASTRAQTVARTSSTVLAAFQDFDHQIRYADAINFPGSGASGARYVEFHTSASSSATGVAMCGQWRYTPSTGKLEFRQWQEGAALPTTWGAKLSLVKGAATATYPFEMEPASSSGFANQQLDVSITAGSTAFAQDANISTQFLARNSSILSPSNAQSVTAGVSDTPVCAPSGYRP